MEVSKVTWNFFLLGNVAMSGIFFVVGYGETERRGGGTTGKGLRFPDAFVPPGAFLRVRCRPFRMRARATCQLKSWRRLMTMPFMVALPLAVAMLTTRVAMLTVPARHHLVAQRERR
eukprot:433759-Rhodomonas_salina.4